MIPAAKYVSCLSVYIYTLFICMSFILFKTVNTFFYVCHQQYYYNSKTQQYLYWDSQKQTYIPVPAESDTSTEQVSKESRDKKEKPKSKSAQQVKAT